MNREGPSLYNLTRLALVFLILSVSITKGDAQSKCDKVCSNDFTCSSGKCILTQCSDSGTDNDTDSCFQYCLNCAGVESCYGYGSLCDYSENLVRLAGSSMNRYSFPLAFSCLTTAILFVKTLHL